MGAKNIIEYAMSDGTGYGSGETMEDDFGYPGTEIRVMPMNGEANALVSRRGYARMIADRMEANKRLGEFAQWKLPSWDDLKVYFTGGKLV